ncbi:hypothetical protein Vi05172_g5289 [Venturia inaequalis]|nr:hypothetical protein Vi05172_g5289 [Venturia inaequalis]
MADTTAHLEKAGDGRIIEREEDGDSIAGEMLTSADDDTVEEDILRSDGPTDDQILGLFGGASDGEGVVEREDAIGSFGRDVAFDDIRAVHPGSDDISQVEAGEMELSLNQKQDTNTDTDMTNTGTSTTNLPEEGEEEEEGEKDPTPPSSPHSSDLEITWQDVLMGTILPSEGLLTLQLKATPPLIPIEIWSPWLHTLNDPIDNLVRDAISQIAFLDYIVLCRTASRIPSKHPAPITCIIFIIENCLKTTHKPLVLKVNDAILTYLSSPENMEKMHLSCFEEHADLLDSGIFRESKRERVKLFGDFLAVGRSEEKLTHAVKGFLLDDQGGKLVKIAPRRVRALRS